MANNSTLWNENSQSATTMRPPNVKPDELLNKQETNSTDKPKNDVLTSNLRVEASEFFPSYYQPPATSNKPRNSVQNRLNVHRKETANDSATHNGEVTMDEGDLARFHQIITTLTNDPGQFDNLQDLFMDTLWPYLNNDIIALKYIADVLVDQATKNQSFRYSGAKLCYHLEQNSPQFRAQLHLTCKRELEKKQNSQNVLLFIAELYTQLHHQNIYGDLVINCIKDLLSIGGNDNVKCSCQALKLTGYSLEKYNKAALDDVFKLLEAVRCNVSGSASILVNSVLSLRQQQWGHSSGDSNPSEEPDFYDEQDAHGTVFFNSDGHAFSNEENEFLASNMNYAEEFNGDFDPDELCDPEPEMDEEIQAAFKEFVKLNKR